MQSRAAKRHQCDCTNIKTISEPKHPHLHNFSKPMHLKYDQRTQPIQWNGSCPIPVGTFFSFRNSFAFSSASNAKCPPTTGRFINVIPGNPPVPTVSYKSVNGRS